VYKSYQNLVCWHKFSLRDQSNLLYSTRHSLSYCSDTWQTDVSSPTKDTWHKVYLNTIQIPEINQ